MAAAVQQRIRQAPQPKIWINPYKQYDNVQKKVHKVKKNIIVNRLVVAFVSFLILSFIVYYHTVVVEKSLNDKQNIIIKFQEQNCVLRNNLSQLQALPQVDQHATDKLAMTTPTELTYLTISKVQLALPEKVIPVSKPFKFSLTTPVGY